MFGHSLPHWLRVPHTVRQTCVLAAASGREANGKLGPAETALCCLQIDPRLKDILKLEVWLKKVSLAVKHEQTYLAP